MTVNLERLLKAGNLRGTISQSCNYQNEAADYNKSRVVTCPLILSF